MDFPILVKITEIIFQALEQKLMKHIVVVNTTSHHIWYTDSIQTIYNGVTLANIKFLCTV